MYRPVRLYAFYLLIYLSPVLGDVTLTVSPTATPKAGTELILNCSVIGQVETTNRNTCKFWWTRTTYPGRGIARIDLENDNHMSIDILLDQYGHAAKSILTIFNMQSLLDGHYACSLLCPDLVETASVSLEVPTTIFGGNNDAVVSTIIVSLIVFCVLLCATSLACMECCFKSKGCRSTSMSSSESSDATDSDSSLLVEADMPPRYSLVVVTNDEAGVDTALTNQDIQRFSDNPSIDGVYVLPQVPPSYAQALLDLAEKGIIFNADSIKPMPPSYEDIISSEEV